MALNTTALLKNMTTQSGVYLMRDAQQTVLYVGKAANLKARLKSYFYLNLPIKTAKLMTQVADISVTITSSEKEALILECNLIKSHKPKYNVLLRDDKSYPYIYISDDEFPRMASFRGTRTTKGKYYGPYPSATAVKETLELMQKLFRVRQCDNTFFSHRSRPCLQYQINRCSAPCVNMITKEQYQSDLQRVTRLLDGHDKDIIPELVIQMNQAASLEQYEKAAQFRDSISALQKIAERQSVESDSADYVDIISIASNGQRFAIHALTIREGQVRTTENYFPKANLQLNEDQILYAFLSQMYLNAPSSLTIPKTIACSILPADTKLLEQAISEIAKTSVKIRAPKRGAYVGWLSMATESALEGLTNDLYSKNLYEKRFLALQKAIGLNALEKAVCFDISHTQGEETMASCVVFDTTGPNKQLYRRYGIETTSNGDDYAAMREAVERYLSRIENRPDVIIVDGGKGQLKSAIQAQCKQDIPWIPMLAISKGPERKAGKEVLYFSDKPNNIFILELLPEHDAFHMIQHMRDEAHRFAINGHRKRRDKQRSSSALEHIPGIGPVRRKKILEHFGGMQQLKQASVDAISKVPGISRALAEALFKNLKS